MTTRWTVEMSKEQSLNEIFVAAWPRRASR